MIWRQAVFAAFTHSLAHRGPDGFGIEHFPEARLWLGHRRLAILDLSERARQPMSYAEGRYWLTYNGEVYNYSSCARNCVVSATVSSLTPTARSSSPPMRNGGRSASSASMACGPLPSGMPKSIGCSCRATASASSRYITAITPAPSSSPPNSRRFYLALD